MLGSGNGQLPSVLWRRNFQYCFQWGSAVDDYTGELKEHREHDHVFKQKVS